MAERADRANRKCCQPGMAASPWTGLPVPSTDPAQRRERAIRLTVAASIGAKVFSIACTFAQVPLALHYLGTEAYGFWVTLVSIVLILSSVDFGLGVGMQHAMARAHGNDDVAAMKRSFWTGATVLGVLGLAVLAVGVPLTRARWADVLHIRDATLRAETGDALLVALAAFVVGLPFNAVARLAAALQMGWINAWWIAAGSAFSLGLVAAAAYGHWGFLWFLAASLLVPSLQGFGLFIHLLRLLRWRMRPAGFAPASEIRTLLRSSLYFAFPQFGIALLQSAPALAISVAAGSSSVTAYNLLMRLFGPFQQGQFILLTPIWPAYTEAHQRDDHRWVRRTFWRTGAAFCAFALGLAMAAWQSHRLLMIWVGSSADLVAPALAGVVALWCLLQMAAQPFIYYLMGVGRLRELAWAGTPGFVASAAILFWGARTGAVEGVLEAGCAGLVLTVIPPLAMTTFRVMRQHEAERVPQ